MKYGVRNICLVLITNWSRVMKMDKPWYRRMFPRPQESVEPVRASVQSQADAGEAEAQFSLGLKFANGAGNAQDYSQAAEWYLRAARQNHCLAQFNLGMMYSRGQGVQRNEDDAVAWILKAANQGDAGAQFVLGIKLLRKSFEEMANAAVESKIESYKWLHLSTAQGYGGSENALHSLIFGMTHEAVTEGNQRAASFLARHSSQERTEQKSSASRE